MKNQYLIYFYETMEYRVPVLAENEDEAKFKASVLFDRAPSTGKMPEYYVWTFPVIGPGYVECVEDLEAARLRSIRMRVTGMPPDIN